MKLEDAEKLPSVLVSEKKIEEDAPAALRYLMRVGRMDAVEPLGLGPHA